MNMNEFAESILDDETKFAGVYDLTVTPLLCDDLVIQYCAANACGKYDANWTCPPGVGDPKVCMDKVRSYSKVLIFRSEYKIGAWYEYEFVEETIRKHQANVRRIREMIPKDIGDHLLLSGGGCVYCKECAYVKKEPCRHPDIAIAPIEAYGVDIFRFTKKNKIKYGSPEGEMYYFGMILFN
jgi:predicted metal-binding protein